MCMICAVSIMVIAGGVPLTPSSVTSRRGTALTNRASQEQQYVSWWCSGMLALDHDGDMLQVNNCF
jgi:hypothetical protein